MFEMRCPAPNWSLMSVSYFILSCTYTGGYRKFLSEGSSIHSDAK